MLHAHAALMEGASALSAAMQMLPNTQPRACHAPPMAGARQQVLIVESKYEVSRKLAETVAPFADARVCASPASLPATEDFAARLALAIIHTELGAGRGLEFASSLRRWAPECGLILNTDQPFPGIVNRVFELKGLLVARPWSQESLGALVSMLAALTVPNRPDTAPARLAELIKSRRLTKREADIVSLACAGYSRQAMSLRLGVSLNTVKWHVGLLLKKCACESLSDLRLCVLAPQSGRLQAS